MPLPASVLILSDIEGSSGCRSYAASSFMTAEWAAACRDMSRDVAVVTAALFAAGVQRIRIKDFHRTGFNLLPEGIDPRATVISGYCGGPVPGIGDPGDAEAALFLGMHAASGDGGFLPHTLTSRISRLRVNGRLMPEIELFAASLAPFGIRPVFFSGCPVACAQARASIPGIDVFPVEKEDPSFDPEQWHPGLARAAVRSLGNPVPPFLPAGPFHTGVTLRDGREAARKLSRRWSLPCDGSTVFFSSPHMHHLYMTLIRLCYLTPVVEQFLRPGLFLSNLRGRLGLAWVRRQLRRQKKTV